MEFWKLLILWCFSLLAKSIGFVWAVNELFGLGIEYSLATIAASAIFIYCVTGTGPVNNTASQG